MTAPLPALAAMARMNLRLIGEEVERHRAAHAAAGEFLRRAFVGLHITILCESHYLSLARFNS